MSSRPEREFVDPENIKPITTGIGSLVEGGRILGVDQIPTQADALRMATARSFLPGVAGWLGSRAGAVGGSFVGSFAGPAGTIGGGFAGSTAGGGIASSFTQWLQNKVVPVSGREIYAMGKYPKTTMAGGYLASSPFLRGSSLNEWSRDPLGRAKNAAGELVGEGAGALALHLSAGGKLKNFDWQGETIGAAIESVLQNEETKLGNLLAGKIGLGSTLPPPVVLTPRSQSTPNAQRNIVAEATGAQTVVPPVAAPGATTIPPAPTSTTIPTPPAATTVPPIPGATIPPAPGANATVPPVAAVPPTAATNIPVPPAATTGASQPSVIQSEDVEVDEDFQPVEPRPSGDPTLAAQWDAKYKDTHRPTGVPMTYVDPMPSAESEARKDPAWNPAWDTPDRGTGLPLNAEARPRIAPNIQSDWDSTGGLTFKDETAADILAGLEAEAKTNPQMAEYLKNNKVAVDQGIQKRLEWNKKYGQNYQPDGSLGYPTAMLDVLGKYYQDEKLAKKTQSWLQANGNTHWSHDGRPMNSQRESRRLRESIEFRKAKMERAIINKEAGWRNQNGDTIIPRDEDGKRYYEVSLYGDWKQKIRTRSVQGALDVIKNRKATTSQTQTATPTPTATQTQATTDTKDTKDTTKPTSGPVEVTNIDDLIKNGGGNAAISQGGKEVKFDKFAVSISDGEATVGYVEMADKTQTGKGIGKAAYIALGKALAARGITLKSSGSLLGPGNKLWLSLVRDGYAVRQGSGYSFVDKDSAQATQAQPAPQAQTQQKPDNNQAEVTPEQLAQIAKIFATVPEYKWASPVGDAYGKFRMEVMKALGAQNVTKSNSGVNAYRDLIIDKFGIDRKQTIAQIDKDIIAFLKKLFKGSSGSLDNDDAPKNTVDTTTTQTQKDKKQPTGPKPGPASITKPLTEEEKDKLQEIVQRLEDDVEEDPDNRIDPDSEFHPIFDDISERNNYADRKTLAAELKAKLGKDFEGSAIQKSLKSWEAPTKPVEFTGVKTPVGNTGLSVAFGPSPTQSKKSRGVVIVFDEDGKAILVGNMDSYDGKTYSRPPSVGLFYNHGDSEYAGRSGETLTADEIVRKYGEEKAAEIYAAYVDTVIKSARETLLREIKEKGKASSGAQTIEFNRTNEDMDKIKKGDLRADLINLILGLDGTESDADYVAAVEKRFGVKFVETDELSYGERNNQFYFDILAPGVTPVKATREPSKLNNNEEIIASEYDDLFERVESPTEEAQKLRAKRSKLDSSGAAYARVTKELDALDRKHAKELFEKYKIFRPDDPRYVKGTRIPLIYPGQRNLRNVGEQIERIIEEIYRPISGGVGDAGGDWGGSAFSVADSRSIVGDAIVDIDFASKSVAERLSAFDKEAGDALAKNQALIDERNKILDKLSNKLDVDNAESDIARISKIDEERFALLEKVLISADKLSRRRLEMIEETRKAQQKAGYEFKLDNSGTVAVFDSGVEDKSQFTKSPSQRRLEQIESEARSKKRKDGGVDWDAYNAVKKKYEKEIDELLKQPSFVPYSQSIVIKSKDGTQIGSATLSFETDLSEPRRDEGDTSRIVKISIGQGSLTKDQATKLMQVIGTRIELINRKNKEAYWQEREDREEDSKGKDSGELRRIMETNNDMIEVIQLNSGASKEAFSAFKKTFADDDSEKTKEGMRGNVESFPGLSYILENKQDRDLFAAVSEQMVRDVKNQIADTIGIRAKDVDEFLDEDIDDDDKPDPLGAQEFIDGLVEAADDAGNRPGSSFDQIEVMNIVREIRDFRSGKTFGDEGQAQAQAKPAKPTKPAATEAKPTTPAMDSVTAIAQEKPDDSASLKAARTKLRAVIAKLGADSQQAAAMAKNIAQAEKKQASFNTAAQTNLKPYGTVAEPAAVTQARQVMSEELKKGRSKSLAYNKALATIDQYENEYDLFTGTVTEEGIQRVSTKALEAFLSEAQEAIDAAGGMSKAGDTLKAELGTTFKLAEKEMERRVREDERRDQYGDLLADIASIVKSSKGAIAIPTLPQALGSSFSETSQMFDKGLTTGANSILRQPMFGIDAARYKSDRDYKADVNNKAEAMIEKLAMSLSSMGWSQFDPTNVSSNELMAALVEAGMGKALVPKDGVIGAAWKGDVGNVPSMTNTDTAQLPKDLFQPTKKPKQLGATQSNELIDESETFNLSGETVAPATTQTAKDEQTQDLAPETEEPAYIAQARAQLAKLEKSGKNLAQQQTLRDTIEQYEASKKQPEPQQEQATEAQPTTGVATEEQTEEYESLKSQADDTISDLESTAGGQAKADKAVNGKKGLIAMVRDAIEKFKLGENPQDTADMLRAASTVANELADSNEEAANNIEDMGREDQFSDRGDMIDQLRELAETLDQMADISEAVAGNQSEQGGTTEKRSSNQIMDEINALREERRKETDAVLENSKLGLRETEEALTAIAKKYDPQFKKLNADFKNATKNLPGGSLGIERSIALDNDKANTILKYKRKLDAGIITQEQYDQMEATLLGKKKDANNDGEQASQTTEVPQEGGKTTIRGKNIAMPLPDSITNQDKKDAVVVLVMTEIRNQIRNSQNGIGTNTYLGDFKKIKGAEAFVFEKIKAFLDKNPSASYLEVVANLYQVSLPNSTKSLKGKLADAQALNAILMDAYRTAVANLRLSQIANGIPESEVISGDIRSSQSDAISGYRVMNEIGLFDSILRFFNTSNAPYAAGEVTADPRKGKPKNDADELLGNTAFGMMRRFNDTVNKLILTGKYTTTTSLLDAVVNDLEAQIKNGTNTKIENEVLTKIKAYINSKKSADPFSRFDRFADDNDKARELDKRIDRNAKNRKGDPDARKGFTGMIARALDELRLRGEITAKEAEGLTRIMNYIGSQFFSGEKMSIKNDNERGYYGMYSWGDQVLTIFRDAMRDGRFEYTAAHEIAHLLTKYLPEKDRIDLINEWRSARKKYLKENPGIAAVLKDPYVDFNSTHFSSLDVQKAESIQPGASKLFVQKVIPVGLRGKTKTVYVIAAHEGVYQIFNADEFFAENFARIVMKRLNSDPAYTGNPNTWREKLASLWDMIKTGFRQMFGKDVTARILADFAKGRITPDMKGNYGLDALHTVTPSKGDSADLSTWNTRHGQEAMTVTEQSEKELEANVIKALDKSMTIKDAMHMILRGAKGGKLELMKLLTSKYNREYEVQFSSKSYEQIYGQGQKTSEGKPIQAKRVRGAHVAGGQYIRLFPADILASAKKHNISYADALAYVLTHEVIHSYTLEVVNTNSIMRRQATDLVKEIREELSLTMTEAEIDKRFYGLSSPAELLTECLIDAELRDIANSVKTKTKRLSELYGNTLLDKIVSLFQNALESIGIKVNRDSVLERVTEMIAIGRDEAASIKKGTQFLGSYSARDDVRNRGKFRSTQDYAYSPDSPTGIAKRAAVSRDKTNTAKDVARLMSQAQRAREEGNEEFADIYERHAAERQMSHDEFAARVERELKGETTPMLEQAIPDLKDIDGNDSPSARATLLGIRDDVMPSIGPANRAPVRKTEEKSIGQIAWDVVSGRYFSGISTKAHQNADRHEYSETVKQVANMIHSRPGVDSNSTERDIPTAMMTSRIKFQNKFQEIVGPLRDMLAGFKDTAAGTAQEQREVVYRALHDMIRGEKPITKGKLGEVATKLKGLFKELRDYRIEAGENLGDVEDYYPAVYDSPRIAQSRDAFIRDASEAYKITIQDLANPDIYLSKMSKMDSKKLAKLLGVTQDEVEAGVTEKGVSISDLMQQKAANQANSALAKELGITREEVEDGASESGVSIDQLILERAAGRATELFQTHLRGMGSEEFDSIFGGGSGSGKENTNLSRVFGAEAQKVMSKWQVADPFRVVTSYITSSVKKAEVVRKFGAEGEFWKQYAEQMEADGVPYEVISEMRELVRVASGYGVQQKNKAAQTYVDSITMMTAASAMGRGFLNNLVEPVTMGIRAGNPFAAARGLVETWVRFIREVVSLSPAIKAKLGETFWSEYGKEIGTIHSSIEDAWMATHSMDLDADRADPRFRWITNRIYQANLMDASEVAKQQASHAIGYGFILGLAKLKQGKSWMNALGMDTTQSTTDQLNELGVPEDQHADFAKFVMSLEKMNDVDRMKAMTENSEMAKLHQEAMVRFSYQSSVRSNRAHKPVFQDDLFGKTVLQLMNFSYSFAAEVNSRLFSMTKQAFSFSPDGKNYAIGDRLRMAAPVMSGFLAIVAYKMLFSLKDELYPTEGTERRKKDPEFLKWVNATSYAGFLGPKAEQLIKIIKRDQAPGGPVGQSLVNVARAATTGIESAVQGKDMGTAKRQAAKAAIPVIKGTLNAGAAAVNPILGAFTTQATNTTGWANELTEENKPSKGVGDALFAKPIKPKKLEK